MLIGMIIIGVVITLQGNFLKMKLILKKLILIHF